MLAPVGLFMRRSVATPPDVPYGRDACRSSSVIAKINTSRSPSRSGRRSPVSTNPQASEKPRARRFVSVTESTRRPHPRPRAQATTASTSARPHRVQMRHAGLGLELRARRRPNAGSVGSRPASAAAVPPRHRPAAQSRHAGSDCEDPRRRSSRTRRGCRATTAAGSRGTRPSRPRRTVRRGPGWEMDVRLPREGRGARGIDPGGAGQLGVGRSRPERHAERVPPIVLLERRDQSGEERVAASHGISTADVEHTFVERAVRRCQHHALRPPRDDAGMSVTAMSRILEAAEGRPGVPSARRGSRLRDVHLRCPAPRSGRGEAAPLRIQRDPDAAAACFLDQVPIALVGRAPRQGARIVSQLPRSHRIAAAW